LVNGARNKERNQAAKMGLVTDHHEGIVETGKPSSKASDIVKRKEPVHFSTERTQLGATIEQVGCFSRALQRTVPDFGRLDKVAGLEVFAHRARLPASPAAEGAADFLLLTYGVSVAHNVKIHRCLIVCILPVWN
jgi:hypothetical protein